MERIYTLKVYPQGQGNSVYRVIEISEKETLNQLCAVILDSFDFTHEHLFEFCMDNKMYSENSYRFIPEGEGSSTDIKIEEIGLKEKQKFSLHYDFGDDWMFVIVVQEIREASDVMKSRVVKMKGSVEQYTSWEDE